MKLLNKFTVVMVALVIVGGGAILTFTYMYTRSQLQSRAADHQQHDAHTTAEFLDQYVTERKGDIEALTDRRVYGDALRSTDIKSQESNAAVENMNQFRAVRSEWVSLAVLDTKSQIHGSTDAEVDLLADVAVNDLYHQALKGVTVHSDLRIDTVRKTPVITFMAPLKQNNEVIGVLAGILSWSAGLDILREIEDGQVYLFSQDGTLLGSNNKKTDPAILTDNYRSKQGYDRLVGQSGTTILPAFDGSGREMLVAYTSGHDNFVTGWILTVGVPLDEIFAPAAQQTLTLSAILILVVIMTVGATIWLFRREVAQPIRTLNAAITRISLGDLSQVVPPLPQGEIGALGRNFNEMVRQLTSTHRSLYQTTQVAAEGRAQLEASINGLRQGFILTDAKGKPIMSNDAVRTLLQEAGGHHRVMTSLSTEDLDKMLPVHTHISDEIKNTLEKRQQSKHNNIAIGGRFFNLYLSPVVSKDKAIGCVLLLEDVTEERILQRSRDEFFSIASHELRTPLTAIRGNTAIMQQYFPEALKDPSMSEMVGDIHDSATRLIEIVNDFLDASRLEQNKMQFELQTFKVEPIIERVIYEMASLSRAKGIALNFDQYTLGDLPEVYADPNRVKQVLYNLIGNAVKFTPKGNVTINCLVQDKKLKICVTDTGPGISPEGQQLLFRKFQQTGENLFTRDATRGTGLGLYISKLLLEHMGGQIKLEHSTLGRGTTFSFTLPVASPDKVAKHATASLDKHPHGGHASSKTKHS